MNCPYCNVHIDEHPASRCLDEWVAVDIMGWHKEKWDWCNENGDEMYSIEYDYDGVLGFDPSESISAAWEVVEKFGGGGFITIQGYLYDGRTNYWYVGKRGHIGTKAETLPLAICRAVIMASQ